jgi:hypothetical protein
MLALGVVVGPQGGPHLGKAKVEGFRPCPECGQLITTHAAGCRFCGASLAGASRGRQYTTAAITVCVASLLIVGAAFLPWARACTVEGFCQSRNGVEWPFTGIGIIAIIGGAISVLASFTVAALRPSEVRAWQLPLLAFSASTAARATVLIATVYKLVDLELAAVGYIHAGLAMPLISLLAVIAIAAAARGLRPALEARRSVRPERQGAAGTPPTRPSVLSEVWDPTPSPRDILDALGSRRSA